MPILTNPRCERFCQAIVYGTDSSKKRAYIDAGHKARDNVAETSACRLFRIVQPIRERIQELQEEQKAKLELKDRFTRETLAKRMALASKIAEEDRNPTAIATSEMGIAKLYGLITDKVESTNKADFASAQSMDELGKRLLQTVGFASPDAGSIREAIEANDVFVAELERIRDAAHGLIVDQ